MLEMNGITNLTDRLAVMLLNSHSVTAEDYGPCLKCALGYLADNLLPSTPSDLFLFVKSEHAQQIAMMSWVTRTPNLYILHLDEGDHSSWRMPQWLRPEMLNGEWQWSPGFTGAHYKCGLVGII